MMMQNRLQCDVLVVGGGVAGIAAAVGATRAGASAIIMEKYGFMGGMATAGMVSTICGAYLRSMDGQAVPVSNGFVREFVEKLSTCQQVAPLPLPNGLFILPYAPWHVIRLADNYINDCAVRSLLHTNIISVTKEGQTVGKVECLAWNERIAIQPTCVVDCTGEALVVEMAGGITTRDFSQDASVLFRIDGLNAATQGSRLALMRTIVHAAEKGVIHEDCKNISFVPGHTEGNCCLLSVPIPHQGEGMSSVTEIELHGRRIIEEVMGILIEESYVSGTLVPQPATQVGVRAGKIAKGRDLLTADQVLACVKNEQGVARSCWPIEIWKGGRKPEVKYLPENDYYDIPAGCLIADGLDNVFMGGRCISAEAEAMGSARVIGTALATGYGAGTLAAFQAMGKQQHEAVAVLQEHQK